MTKDHVPAEGISDLRQLCSYFQQFRTLFTYHSQCTGILSSIISLPCALCLWKHLETLLCSRHLLQSMAVLNPDPLSWVHYSENQPCAALSHGLTKLKHGIQRMVWCWMKWASTLPPQEMLAGFYLLVSIWRAFTLLKEFWQLWLDCISISLTALVGKGLLKSNSWLNLPAVPRCAPQKGPRVWELCYIEMNLNWRIFCLCLALIRSIGTD